jgi:hypothetical protein
MTVKGKIVPRQNFYQLLKYINVNLIAVELLGIFPNYS